MCLADGLGAPAHGSDLLGARDKAPIGKCEQAVHADDHSAMHAPQQTKRNPELSRPPCFAGLMVKQDDGHTAQCPGERLCKVGCARQFFAGSWNSTSYCTTAYSSYLTPPLKFSGLPIDNQAMLLFDLLRISEPLLEPAKSKVHLAGWNGFENPLQVYFAGEFDKWQSWQTKRNFERQCVVSLIQLPERHQWLYIGAYESVGSSSHPEAGVTYDLRPLPRSMEWAGRVVCNFERPGR